jgi:CBS domain-containing protein
MLVKHILGAKGRDIIAIAIDASLADAAALLARKRIGAVIVRDARAGLLGVLSERDVVRAVAEHGVAALTKQVGAYMTREVATCCEADSIDSLMEIMTSGRFRHVPVVDEREGLVGIVSIGDVVKSRIEETVREAATLREYISAAG